jgi:hypothetical protein
MLARSKFSVIIRTILCLQQIVLSLEYGQAIIAREIKIEEK